MSDGQRIGDGLMNPGYEAVGKPYEREFTRTGEGLEIDLRIAPADVVDEAGEAVGQVGIGDLEDVFGVQLARVGEVEAAYEDDVVRDRDLGVHVVVDGSGRVGRRVLAREGRPGERRPHERLLPGGIPVQVPLTEHLVDLRTVDDAGQIDLSVRGRL